MALIDFITPIQFGAISLLRQQCERVGICRPLIVTDRGVKAGRPGDCDAQILDQADAGASEYS
jgi:4-hydroxybutyrate dehydrogenase